MSDETKKPDPSSAAAGGTGTTPGTTTGSAGTMSGTTPGAGIKPVMTTSPGTTAMPAGDKSFGEEAKEAKSDAASELKAASNEARDRAASATSEIKDEASELAEQARRRAEMAAMDAKDRLADQGHTMADRLRAAGQEFGDGSMPDRYVGQMADSLSSAADAFASKDLGSLMADAASFARRNPTAFVGGAALLGFAAARFMKASTPEPSYGGGGSYGGPSGYGRSSGYGSDSTPGYASTGSRAAYDPAASTMDRPAPADRGYGATTVPATPAPAPATTVPGAPAVHTSET